jgi:hypothetical protein
MGIVEESASRGAEMQSAIGAFKLAVRLLRFAFGFN